MSFEDACLLIAEIWQRRNPAKLGSEVALLLKYTGYELDVYEAVCIKYKEVPKPDDKSAAMWAEV